ncbi:Asp23/Gls24 family envelope stress response protein, partial [Arthrobacter sp. MDT1-48-3]
MADNQTTVVSPVAAVPITGAQPERQVLQARKTPKNLAAGPLHTDQGKTSIADTVVQKISGIAAREVPGVHAMGNAARRAFDQ